MNPAYATYPLAYATDSARLMALLAHLPRPVFLDSGSQRGPARRFDILSAAPTAWIQLSAGEFTSSDPDLCFSDKDIFSTIKQLQDKYSADSSLVPPEATALPFHGGLLGYLGYPKLTGRATPVPEDAYIGMYDWAIIVDHELRHTTLVAQASCSLERRQQLRALGLDETLPPPPAQFRLLSDFSRLLPRAQYDAAFTAIKEYIRAGDCYQVNLTQQVSAKCSGNPLAAFLHLRQSMPAPFSAYIGWPAGALLSVSPERFLRLQGRDVLTQPIKGTRPRHSQPAQDQALAADLLASEKDQAENLMIVDLLRNDLGRVCEIGTIQANQLFALHSFSNVHHLISSIRARLAPDAGALDLLQACYPGGSITGAPKLRAMAIIEELETAPRRAYCGTAFYVSACGNMDSSITIRSLLWESGEVHCWAGGGIVADSEADAEYAESFDKITRIISSLAEHS